MKKSFVRSLCMILAVILLVGLMGCSQKPTAEEPKDENPPPTTGGTFEAPPADNSIIPDDLPRFKIGVSYMSFTDKLGSQMKNSLDYLADAFNIQFVYVETGTSTEAAQAAVENALQTGLDGFIGVSGNVATIEACKRANTPFVSIGSDPVDIETMSTYEVFVGAVCENDYDVGVKAAESLYAAGVRSLAICGLTAGLSPSHDNRVLGIMDVVSQHDDFKIIAEDYSYGDFAKAISSFAAAFPNMDGLFTAAGNENVYQAITTEGLVGQIKFATVDISESTGDYFESDTLVSIAGGQYGTTMIGFALLYNYLYDQTKIIPNTAEILRRPFLEMRTLEEYQDYLKYVDGSIPVYTIDEMAAMIKGFNPDADFAMFQKASQDYSISDIVARHSALF